MKQLSILLVFLFIAGCSIVKFIPCSTDVNPNSFKSGIIPLDSGNFWVYKVETKGKPTYFQTVVIGGIDTIYYKGENGLTPILGYKVNFKSGFSPSSSNQIFYYIKCQEKVTLVKCDPKNPKFIIEPMNELLENPKIGDISPYDKAEWVGIDSIETTYGILKCNVQSKKLYIPISDVNNIPLDVVTKDKLFFHKGIGLIRTLSLNRFNDIITNMELINYRVKLKKLFSHSQSRISIRS